MDSSTSIHTSSLALSLLRHSSKSSKSFVLSPFSLNTALSIIHDGANGKTQKELTDLLLNGTSTDVTDFYSSLARSLPTSKDTGVAINSAIRLYIDDSISLRRSYQKHIEEKYDVKVDNLCLSSASEATKVINKFINDATRGKIKNIFESSGDEDAILINTVHFFGKWNCFFNPCDTRIRLFNGVDNSRPMDFMKNRGKFQVTLKNEIGTVLIIPYLDEQYNFFYLMPNESSNIKKLRRTLTGEKLVSVLRDAKKRNVDIFVPKFKVESKLDGKRVLQKLGVKLMFKDCADLSQISSTPLKVSKIQHAAMIETNEEGTIAAAVTIEGFQVMGMFEEEPLPQVIIDRPFLFGIRRNEDILFIGQFVGQSELDYTDCMSREQPSRACKRKSKPETTTSKRKKDDDVCSICFEEFDVKRKSQLQCAHRFHRTCILNWLEKQERKVDQACPNCRAPFVFLTCGPEIIIEVENYGTFQQPSWFYIYRKAKLLMATDADRETLKTKGEKDARISEHLFTLLTDALEKTSTVRFKLEEDRNRYVRKTKHPKREYVTDLNDEMTLLIRRIDILVEMEELVRIANGAEIAPPEPVLKNEWNLQSELYNVYNAMPNSETINGNASDLIEGLSDYPALRNTQASIVRTRTTTRERDEQGNPIDHTVAVRIERITVTDDMNIDELRRLGFQIVNIEEPVMHEMILD